MILPAAPPSDRQLSDYTILEPIGSGLRGTVYRARGDRARLVALKVFNRGVKIDADLLRRFSPAAQDPILHPSLVAVEAAGESEGRAFCAQTLLCGDSLEAVLAERRGERRGGLHLSLLGPGPGGRAQPGALRQAVALLLEVAEGLELAHRSGVVHGRLGPRNLIFSPAGRLVVTDFGAERLWSRRVGLGVSHDLATLAYRSPEEIEPSPEGVDCRADVYALGAILYELLTGQKPFNGREPQRLRDLIAEGSFPLPSQLEPLVSPESEAVILRAMTLEPAGRYPTAGRLAEDLRRLLLLEATAAGADLLGAVRPVEAPPEDEEDGTGLETPAGPAPGSGDSGLRPAAGPPAREEASPGKPAAEPEAPPPPPPAVALGASAAPPSLEAGPVAGRWAPSAPEPAPAGPLPLGPSQSGLAPLLPAPLPPAALRPAEPGAAVLEPASPGPALLGPALPGPTPAGPAPLAPARPGRRQPGAAAPGPELLGPAPAAETPAEPAALERPLAARSARRVILLTSAALLALGVAGGWTWLTLLLHDSGERSRVRSEVFSSGFHHLERAVLALFADDPRGAAQEVGETRRLGIAGPELTTLLVELPEKSADGLLQDLAHPRPAVRREAIGLLAREVEAGERPPAALAGLRTALRDADPAVRIAAIHGLRHAESSEPLLSAFPIGERLPVLTIDAATLLALVEVLGAIADGPAASVLLGFSYQDFARLDAPVREGSAAVPLAPNLEVVRSPADPARFAAAWIRARGRIGSAEVFILAERVRRGEEELRPLAGEVIDALAALGGPQAARAIESLAGCCFLEHGSRIAAALLDLGATEELLRLARGGLPVPFRALAAGALGRAAAEGGPGSREAAASGLLALVLRDPEPALRRSALAALEAAGGAAAADALKAALFDPALEEDALRSFASRPGTEALPPLLDLLRRGDSRQRLLAADALGAARDPLALAPLALLLFEGDAALRARALAAMREISPPRALALAAGILPPRAPALLELALEAAHCPLESGESPFLRLLALREPLGLVGADEPPLALREARRALLREGLPGQSEAPAIPLPPRAAAAAGALR